MAGTVPPCLRGFQGTVEIGWIGENQVVAAVGPEGCQTGPAGCQVVFPRGSGKVCRGLLCGREVDVDGIDQKVFAKKGKPLGYHQGDGACAGAYVQHIPVGGQDISCRPEKDSVSVDLHR